MTHSLKTFPLAKCVSYLPLTFPPPPLRLQMDRFIRSGMMTRKAFVPKLTTWEKLAWGASACGTATSWTTAMNRRPGSRPQQCGMHCWDASPLFLSLICDNAARYNQVRGFIFNMMPSVNNEGFQGGFLKNIFLYFWIYSQAGFV